MPESMLQVLLQFAAAMKAGLAVTVAPHHLTLSTQEAADLLRISRTTLVRLLEAGVIPFDKPSRHPAGRPEHEQRDRGEQHRQVDQVAQRRVQAPRQHDEEQQAAEEQPSGPFLAERDGRDVVVRVQRSWSDFPRRKAILTTTVNTTVTTAEATMSAAVA